MKTARNAVLRDIIAMQEEQLVAMDALLEQQPLALSRTLELRRKHACTIPHEILTQFFGRYAWTGSRFALDPDRDPNVALLRPKVYYCAGEVQPGNPSHIDLASARRAVPIPGGVRTATTADTNLSTGYGGFPAGHHVLVTAWRFKWEHPETAPEMDASVEFGHEGTGDYRQNYLVRSLRDALVDEDCLVFLPARTTFSLTYAPQRQTVLPTEKHQRLFAYLTCIETMMPMVQGR